MTHWQELGSATGIGAVAVERPGEPSGKLCVVFERFRRRAERLLEDVPAVEAVLEAAHRRVDRHRSLQKELDPLERLVRSYVRRSYRPKDRSDVLLALAALIYVQSPVDLIPDFAPGGLADDEAVARWVAGRVTNTLDAHAAWEESLGEDWEDLQAVSGPTVDTLPATLNVRVLDAAESALFARADAPGESQGVPIAAGSMVTALAHAGIAIHAGQVLQVLGPPHPVSGLRDGTYHLLETSTVHIGTVADKSGIVGNLRVGSDLSQAAVQGALAAFQVASAVKLQYYLARIDRQLVAIDRQLKSIQQDLLDETFGDIETAREACADVQDALSSIGRLGDLDIQRIAHAEQRIDQAYHAQLTKLEGFRGQVDRLMGGDKLDHDRLGELLTEGSGRRLAQAQLLLYAAVVRHRINGLAVAAAAQESPERAELAAAKLTREHHKMLGDLHDVAATFRRLHLRKQVLDETWPARGGPERELDIFSRSTRGLREQLESPLQALPALQPAEPFLFEFVRDAGGTLVHRHAVLVAT